MIRVNFVVSHAQANPNTTKNLITALKCAVIGRHSQIVLLLLKHGATTEAVGDDKCTCSCSAIRSCALSDNIGYQTDCTKGNYSGHDEPALNTASLSQSGFQNSATSGFEMCFAPSALVPDQPKHVSNPKFCNKDVKIPFIIWFQAAALGCTDTVQHLLQYGAIIRHLHMRI